jgi:hypothetical protein
MNAVGHRRIDVISKDTQPIISLSPAKTGVPCVCFVRNGSTDMRSKHRPNARMYKADHLENTISLLINEARVLGLKPGVLEG